MQSKSNKFLLSFPLIHEYQSYVLKIFQFVYEGRCEEAEAQALYLIENILLQSPRPAMSDLTLEYQLIDTLYDYFNSQYTSWLELSNIPFHVDINHSGKNYLLSCCKDKEAMSGLLVSMQQYLFCGDLDEQNNAENITQFLEEYKQKLFIDFTIVGGDIREKGYEYVKNVFYDSRKENLELKELQAQRYKLSRPKYDETISEEEEDFTYGLYKPLPEEVFFALVYHPEMTLNPQTAGEKGYKWVRDHVFFDPDADDEANKEIMSLEKQGYELGKRADGDERLEQRGYYGLYKSIKPKDTFIMAQFGLERLPKFQSLLDRFKGNLEFKQLISRSIVTPDEYLYNIETNDGQYYIFETDDIADFDYVTDFIKNNVGKFECFVELKQPLDNSEGDSVFKGTHLERHTPDFDAFKKYINDGTYGSFGGYFNFLIKK